MSNRFARVQETLAHYKERRKIETVSAYERKVVKKILVGLGTNRVSLVVGKQEVAPGDEDAYMTMSWLAGEYPSFPVILQARETWLPDIADFFRVRSRKNSFWEVWKELTESLVGNKKPVGCVFPFPKSTSLGHGVVHNADLPYVGNDSAYDFVCMQRRPSEGRTVTLELLDSFINRLYMVWEPS